jgi:hypothetical protein
MEAMKGVWVMLVIFGFLKERETGALKKGKKNLLPLPL